jgi:phosphoglycerate dehydrogenase-like enzyme
MPTFEVAFSGELAAPDGTSVYGEIGQSLLAAARLPWRFLAESPPVLLPEHLAGLDALVISSPRVTRETFSHGAPRLAVIARCGVGYDRVDLDACTAADVALINAPLALATPTAAASLMYMLVLAKQLLPLDALVRQGRWHERDAVLGIELTGKTLGIVGLGHSGRELARLAAPFKMEVLAYSPRADPEQARALGVRLAPLDEVLRAADFLCLHCRLTPETRGLIGARELALMKPTAYLVNMARGPVVDQDALEQALAERRLAGAGLDVFDPEPLPAGHPLTRLDNVVLSPHWTTGTRDVWRAAGESNCRGLLQAARGALPDHIVNPDVIARPGFQAKLARFRSAGSQAP